MSTDRLILVVEDDEDDFFLTARALRKFTSQPILHVESGRAAIAYLAGTDEYTDRAKFPFPDLVFLDLKMDQGGGHEVLAWIRAHLRERVPRVFVLTGSNEPRDREMVKSSEVAAGYIVKPLTPEHLKTIFEVPVPAAGGSSAEANGRGR